MSTQQKRLGIGFEGHKGGELTITLRGPVTTVVGVIVNGMPKPALQCLQTELDTRIAKRKALTRKGRK